MNETKYVIELENVTKYVFEHFNIITVAQWFDRHNITGRLVKIVFPCVAGLAYIGSYLFTTARYDKKEKMIS